MWKHLLPDHVNVYNANVPRRLPRGATETYEVDDLGSVEYELDEQHVVVCGISTRTRVLHLARLHTLMATFMSHVFDTKDATRIVFWCPLQAAILQSMHTIGFEFPISDEADVVYDHIRSVIDVSRALEQLGSRQMRATYELEEHNVAVGPFTRGTERTDELEFRAGTVFATPVRPAATWIDLDEPIVPDSHPHVYQWFKWQDVYFTNKIYDNLTITPRAAETDVEVITRVDWSFLKYVTGPRQHGEERLASPAFTQNIDKGKHHAWWEKFFGKNYIQRLTRSGFVYTSRDQQVHDGLGPRFDMAHGMPDVLPLVVWKHKDRHVHTLVQLFDGTITADDLVSILSPSRMTLWTLTNAADDDADDDAAGDAPNDETTANVRSVLRPFGRHFYVRNCDLLTQKVETAPLYEYLSSAQSLRVDNRVYAVPALAARSRSNLFHSVLSIANIRNVQCDMLPLTALRGFTSDDMTRLLTELTVDAPDWHFITHERSAFHGPLLNSSGWKQDLANALHFARNDAGVNEGEWTAFSGSNFNSLHYYLEYSREDEILTLPPDVGDALYVGTSVPLLYMKTNTLRVKMSARQFDDLRDLCDAKGKDDAGYMSEEEFTRALGLKTPSYLSRWRSGQWTNVSGTRKPLFASQSDTIRIASTSSRSCDIQLNQTLIHCPAVRASSRFLPFSAMDASFADSSIVSCGKYTILWGSQAEATSSLGEWAIELTLERNRSHRPRRGRSGSQRGTFVTEYKLPSEYQAMWQDTCALFCIRTDGGYLHLRNMVPLSKTLDDCVSIDVFRDYPQKDEVQPHSRNMHAISSVVRGSDVEKLIRSDTRYQREAHSLKATIFFSILNMVENDDSLLYDPSLPSDTQADKAAFEQLRDKVQEMDRSKVIAKDDAEHTDASLLRIYQTSSSGDRMLLSYGLLMYMSDDKIGSRDATYTRKKESHLKWYYELAFARTRAVSIEKRVECSSLLAERIGRNYVDLADIEGNHNRPQRDARMVLKRVVELLISRRQIECYYRPNCAPSAPPLHRVFLRTVMVQRHKTLFEGVEQPRDEAPFDKMVVYKFGRQFMKPPMALTYQGDWCATCQGMYKLSQVELQHSFREFEAERCNICFEPLVDETVHAIVAHQMTDQSAHMFHKDCLTRWWSVKGRSECPIDRQDMNEQNTKRYDRDDNVLARQVVGYVLDGTSTTMDFNTSAVYVYAFPGKSLKTNETRLKRSDDDSLQTTSTIDEMWRSLLE